MKNAKLRKEDLTGKRFGTLTVVGLDYEKRKIDEDRLTQGKIKAIHWYWKCVCDCGGVTSSTRSNLERERTTSCGCSYIKQNVKIGDKFGRLVVVGRNLEKESEESNKGKQKQKYWNCKCSCGNNQFVVVNSARLNSGSTLSCGCYRKEMTKKYHSENAKDGNSIMHFLIHKYREDIAIKMTENEFNKTIDLYGINKGSSSQYIHINCLEKPYHEDYAVTPYHLSSDNPTGCPYCSNFQGKVHRLDSIGNKDRNVVNIWSDKNALSPYEYSSSSTYLAWWKCSAGKHDDYQRTVRNYTRSKYDCPLCALENTESMLQKHVKDYITKELKYELRHEYDCSIVPKNPKTKHSMPFDNEVVDLKLIIEVNGEQHYVEYSKNSNWRNKEGLNPEQELHKRKLYDRYKEYIAHIRGYEYLAIPYWSEEDQSYKELIDNKIKYILSKRGSINGEN